MKRVIAGAIIFIVVIGALLGWHKTHAAPAPLPDTLQTTGSGPYESQLIQPKQSPWYITFSYTPLNNSASVTILNQNRNIVSYKLIPTTTPGSIVYQGQGTDPIYVEAYAGDWSMELSY